MKSKTVVRLCSAALMVLAFVVVSQAQAPANVTGTWAIEFEIRGGPMKMTITSVNGGTIKGTLERQYFPPSPLEDASINGNNIAFTAGMFANDERKIYFKGTVSGNTMSGTMMQDAMEPCGAPKCSIDGPDLIPTPPSQQKNPKTQNWTAKRS